MSYRFTPRSWRYSTDEDGQRGGASGRDSDNDDDSEDFYGSTYAHSGAKGWRESMEDVIVAECPLRLSESRRWSLFVVLDGHGGKFAAEFAAERLPLVIAEVNLQLPAEHSSVGTF